MLQLIQLPRDESAPGLARRAVAGAAEFVDRCLVEDATLLVSELVTNSVLYGDGGEVTLRIQANEQFGLRCEVLDDGMGFVPTAPVESRGPGGWGLQLVDRLADCWGVTAGSTHVWFEISTADRRAGAPRASAQPVF